MKLPLKTMAGNPLDIKSVENIFKEIQDKNTLFIIATEISSNILQLIKSGHTKIAAKSIDVVFDSHLDNRKLKGTGITKDRVITLIITDLLSELIKLPYSNTDTFNISLTLPEEISKKNDVIDSYTDVIDIFCHRIKMSNDKNKSINYTKSLEILCAMGDTIGKWINESENEPLFYTSNKAKIFHKVTDIMNLLSSKVPSVKLLKLRNRLYHKYDYTAKVGFTGNNILDDINDDLNNFDDENILI